MIVVSGKGGTIWSPLCVVMVFFLSEVHTEPALQRFTLPPVPELRDAAQSSRKVEDAGSLRGSLPSEGDPKFIDR